MGDGTSSLLDNLRLRSQTSSDALPLMLGAWAMRCLSDDTAPLLASLALAQACDGVDDTARKQWRMVHDMCFDTALAPHQVEPDAATEREASAMADAALGEGPVSIQVSPPEGGLGASSASFVSDAGRPKGTFGSSREDSTFGAISPSLVAVSKSKALRTQLPGPGAYSPTAEHGVSQQKRFPAGASWGKEDRYKHLGYTVRPRHQFVALPLRCGPAPGFYSTPVFPCPKERAVRGDRCQAKLFRPAAELPAGQPPERNRERVAEARSLNRLGHEGPGPTAYAPDIHSDSQYPNRLGGRWSAAARGVGAVLAGNATDAGERIAQYGEHTNERDKGGCSDPGAATADARDGDELHTIQRQRATIIQKSRDRRLDLRRRDVVEDELDKVRQRHRLLAAGAKRTIGGKLLGSKPHTKEGASTADASVDAEGEGDIAAQLRHRLDGSLQRMSDLFRAIDTSWDGYVSRDELGLALRALGLDVSREELRALFAQIDTDNSGEIDFKELKRALQLRPDSPKKDENKAAAGRRRWEAAQRATATAQLYAGQRKRAVATRHGSPWALGTGRDVSTDLLSGVEPPERRSLGPATYDPRPGTDYVKPSVRVGGDLSRGLRQQLMPLKGSASGYVFAGLPNGLPEHEPQFADDMDAINSRHELAVDAAD